jgi:hypothetical protein
MLFLLNDTVLEVGSTMKTPPGFARQVASSTMDELLRLVGQEFEADRDFARRSPVRAQRAALMLLLKAPTHNAALFVPGPDGVRARLASLDLLVMFQLKGVQDAGQLTASEVNARVWATCAPA